MSLSPDQRLHTPSPIIHARGRQYCSIDAYRRHAALHLPRPVHGFYAGGSDDEVSLRDNEEAYTRLKFLPRYLQDVSSIDTSTEVLGHRLSFPIIAAPTAYQNMAAEGGELNTVRALRKKGVGGIISSCSSMSLEEIASAFYGDTGAQPAPRTTSATAGFLWFQLYVFKDRRITESLVRRAEAAGYTALVLTIDVPVAGNRERDHHNAFTFPPQTKPGNFQEMYNEDTEARLKFVSVNEYMASLMDASLNWTDVEWLKTITSLPLVIKGILSPQDAVLAAKHGASAVVVSNHGGRQLDGVPATIDCLPAVVNALKQFCACGRVGPGCCGRGVTVLVDGGIVRGSSVLKAMALGASAVLVGRPILWGLAHSGQDGVESVLEILRSEVERCMALSGCVRCSDITRELLWQDPRLSSNHCNCSNGGSGGRSGGGGVTAKL